MAELQELQKLQDAYFDKAKQELDNNESALSVGEIAEKHYNALKEYCYDEFKDKYSSSELEEFFAWNSLEIFTLALTSEKVDPKDFKKGLKGLLNLPKD